MQKSGIGENKVDRGLRWLGLKGNTIPSVFRLTLRMMPKDPFPMMSSGSYRSRKEDIGKEGRKREGKTEEEYMGSASTVSITLRSDVQTSRDRA